MVASNKGDKIEARLEKGEWEEARALIESELAKCPDDHWLLTQLGVTYYEQREYRKSLRCFLDSLEIMPDCPLTLWNLAGALDASSKPKLAIQVYAELLRSNTTAASDPCWESTGWADSLKTDCVYRLGMCFQRMREWKPADRCFRHYIDLLLAGKQSIYTIEDAFRRIREVHSKNGRGEEKEFQDVIDSTLQDTAIKSIERDRRKLSEMSVEELLAR